ncbi:MAG: winged helix-turn-helix domain-containing protein [Kordiimonas sp.]
MPSINFNKFVEWLKPNRENGDGFSYDPLTGTLNAAGSTTVFRPKTAAVFKLLLSNPERIIAKTELLEEVWNGVTVQEQAVFQSITEIRQAFADPKCIRTHPRKGYQWVGGQPSTRKSLIKHTAPYWAVAALFIVLVANVISNKDALPSDRPSIAVTAVTSENVAARDTGLPGMVTEMLGHHISANGIGYPIGAERTADINVELHAARAKNMLLVSFKISNEVGEIEGSYQHTSITWIIHQIAHQLHDAATYSLIEGAPSTRVALHKRKLVADSLLTNGDRDEAIIQLTNLTAEDPSYLSATYDLLNTTRRSDNPSFDVAVSTLLKDAINQQDSFNEIRALLLQARRLAQAGHYAKAIKLADRGFELAQTHHYPYLEASFDLGRGRWESALGLASLAISRFQSAANQYQLIECPAGEITALELLAENLESEGETNQAQQRRQKAAALKALGY